jgi:hypothetical protein
MSVRRTGRRSTGRCRVRCALGTDRRAREDRCSPRSVDARYGPDDGAFTAAIEDWRAGSDHGRAEGPGTGDGSGEHVTGGASIALGVPTYCSAACIAGAVRDGGCQGSPNRRCRLAGCPEGHRDERGNCAECVDAGNVLGAHFRVRWGDGSQSALHGLWAVEGVARSATGAALKLRLRARPVNSRLVTGGTPRSGAAREWPYFP